MEKQDTKKAERWTRPLGGPGYAVYRGNYGYYWRRRKPVTKRNYSFNVKEKKKVHEGDGDSLMDFRKWKLLLFLGKQKQVNGTLP